MKITNTCILERDWRRAEAGKKIFTTGDYNFGERNWREFNYLKTKGQRYKEKKCLCQKLKQRTVIVGGLGLMVMDTFMEEFSTQGRGKENRSSKKCDGEKNFIAETDHGQNVTK